MKNPVAPVSIYDADFYRWQQEGSLRSARSVVPLLLAEFNVSSVIDVGCGVGTWLSVFRENGVTEVLGVDGDHVDRMMLTIPESQFIAADLRAALPPTRTFDLALCLEVAEHLPSHAGDALVYYLTSLAPVIIFSAAIPGQGGTDHLNEQWQDYWRQRFAARGFDAVDLIRPRIRGNQNVDFWYQQNLICYCNSAALERLTTNPVESGVSLNLVHPHLFEQTRDRGKMYLSKALGMLPELAMQAAIKRTFSVVKRR